MKRLVALLAALIAVATCLTGCFGEQPGSPTAGQTGSAVWSQTLSGTEVTELDINAALNVCNTLVAETEQLAQHVTSDDLNRLKATIVLLNELSVGEAPEFGYFLALRNLYRTFYSFYAGNCESGAIDDALVAAIEAYNALPPSLKPEFSPINGESVLFAANNLESFAASSAR